MALKSTVCCPVTLAFHHNTGVCLTGLKKQHSPGGNTDKNVVPLFQSSAKDDPMNAFDRVIIEEEIHSLVLTETSESTNSEKENR